MDALDQQLLAAHEQGDADALCALYLEAGENAERRGEIEAACFYLTHAYVFALEAGSPSAKEINRKLVEYGREEPL